jgi:GNAT superfamily N-acetyltransferase
MDFTIREAGPRDVDALTALINAAFEVEQFFKQGDRTSPSAIRDLLGRGAVLVADGLGAPAAGSVYVEPRGDRVYIGMVSVDPRYQGRGLGRLLMESAEAYGRSRGCVVSDITVVNLRTELPPFYRKLGYVETGTSPFPDSETTTLPCHLITMSKRLEPEDQGV